MTIKQHSTITVAIAATVESAINNALDYDPASKRAVGELIDILAIEVTPAVVPAMTLYCQGSVHGVKITSHCELPVAARLTGSPTALLALLNRPPTLADSGVELVGDVSLLQRWQAILDNLDIDWETCLQNYLGDIAGPITATMIGEAGQWLRHQSRYHQHQLSVYLQEELAIVPPKAEFDDFYRQIDELVLSIDRVQARIQQLHETVTNNDEKESHLNNNADPKNESNQLT